MSVAEPRINLPWLQEAKGKMRVHHAGAAFLFESVLVFLAEAVIEAAAIDAIGRGKPVLH